jgi:hypothetical protein
MKLVMTIVIAALVALGSTARSEPLDNPYRDCSQQTLEEAIALERLGDREALHDHVRSFGCKLIWPREAFELFDEPMPPSYDSAPRALRRPAGHR